MKFSGSVSAAMSFSLAGDPAVGTETKAVAFSNATALGNGTAANQAQVGWGTIVVVPAGQTCLVDLQAADGTAFGFAGVVAFSSVRGVYIENQSTVAAQHVLVGIAGGTDATGYAVHVEGGGSFVWSAPTAGRAITNANRYLTVTNPGAVSVAVAIGVVGTGTTQDN